MAAEGLQGSSSLGEVHLSALSLSPKRKEPLWEAAPLCSHTHKGKAAVNKESASNSTPEPLRRHRTETMGRGSTAGPPQGLQCPCVWWGPSQGHTVAQNLQHVSFHPSRDLTNWPWSLQDTHTSNHSLPGVTPRVPLLAWVGTHSELRVGINLILS